MTTFLVLWNITSCRHLLNNFYNLKRVLKTVINKDFKQLFLIHTYKKPKHVAAFTCTIRVVYREQYYIFLDIRMAEHNSRMSQLLKIFLKVFFQKHPAVYQYVYSTNTGMYLFLNFNKKETCDPVTRYDVGYASTNLLRTINVSS
jgi:hypothetical protein